MLELKYTVTEMKIAFNGLISRLDMAEDRISEVEYTSKTGKQREQSLKKDSRISKDCETTTKGVAYTI